MQFFSFMCLVSYQRYKYEMNMQLNFLNSVHNFAELFFNTYGSSRDNRRKIRNISDRVIRGGHSRWQHKWRDVLFCQVPNKLQPKFSFWSLGKDGSARSERLDKRPLLSQPLIGIKLASFPFLCFSALVSCMYRSLIKK